ncbi:prepilin-type N-terminal cleavage/methylation domain-containing protein [Opitutaceae bacterium TAV1]|nr:prepilin-type N-terminal cleavage/methylation domain-containing protein [Opitutaceae bacterium TAV1]
MNTKTTRYIKTAAFTLIELLTVIAIIGILAAIIIPTVGKVRETARSVQCLSNLREINRALLLYVEDQPQKKTPRFDFNVWPVVFPYAYPNCKKDGTGKYPISYPAGKPTPDLAGTIFECPNVYSDTCANPRSYGANSSLLNSRPGNGNRYVQGIPIHQVELPSKAATFGDALNASDIHNNTQHNLNPRHNNRANVVFLDGHAAAIKITPELDDFSLPETKLFWHGITD